MLIGVYGADPGNYDSPGESYVLFGGGSVGARVKLISLIWMAATDSGLQRTM